MGKVPAVPGAGVPLSIPVEVLNVTPDGSVPASLSIGMGAPVAVTVNEPSAPMSKVMALALLIIGAWPTINVKLCVAELPTPLRALKVMKYVPLVPAAGVPLNKPLEAVNVIPDGSAPVSLKLGVGEPVAVTVNEFMVPMLKTALLALVIAAG
jgi:hypothetical protein